MAASKETLDRRKFILRSSQVLAGTALTGGAVTASTKTDGEYFVLDSAAENFCGTCQHWGGRRRISVDGKSIEFDSLGWCNNPKSPNYRKTTGPKGGMQMVWEKWSEIPA